MTDRSSRVTRKVIDDTFVNAAFHYRSYRGTWFTASVSKSEPTKGETPATFSHVQKRIALDKQTQQSLPRMMRRPQMSNKKNVGLSSLKWVESTKKGETRCASRTRFSDSFYPHSCVADRFRSHLVFKPQRPPDMICQTLRAKSKSNNFQMVDYIILRASYIVEKSAVAISIFDDKTTSFVIGEKRCCSSLLESMKTHFLVLFEGISSFLPLCCSSKYLRTFSRTFLLILFLAHGNNARAAGQDWCSSLNGNVCFRHVFDRRNEIEFLIHIYNGLIHGKSLIGSVESRPAT